LRHIFKWPLALALAGALAVSAMACNDDDDDGDGGPDNTPAAAESPTAEAADGDAADVEQTIRDAIAAWNAKDVNELVTHFTDAGLISSFSEDTEQPREEIIAGLGEFIGTETIEVRELTADVSGATATADVTWTFGRALERVAFGLVDEAGTWKINSEEQQAVEIPAGVTPVNVDLNEFAFAFISSDVTGETLAFQANNVGEQQHELGLAKIPADADIQTLLTTEEDVPGFEFLGGVGPIEPGEDAAIVLVEPLEPGRYAMVCFLPDTAEGPDGTPHALKGMVAEFTLP
jgi:hypothetical protein